MTTEKRCDAPAPFNVHWPGSGPIPSCMDHLGAFLRTANALGLCLTVDTMRDANATCMQGIAERSTDYDPATTPTGRATMEEFTDGTLWTATAKTFLGRRSLRELYQLLHLTCLELEARAHTFAISGPYHAIRGDFPNKGSVFFATLAPLAERPFNPGGTDPE